jgi:hypothetical protein
MRSKKKYSNRKKYVSKRRPRRQKKQRRSKRIHKTKKNKRLNSQRGGGIPFAGTLTGLIGTTHNQDKNMNDLLDNLCSVNSQKTPVNGDIELHNLINNICNVNHGIKQSKKNNGIVKNALRLIGNVATLPLRTASKAVTSVTGVNPTQMVSNMIANSSKNQEENVKPYKMAHSIDTLKKLDQKIKSGGSLTSDEMEVLNSL